MIRDRFPAYITWEQFEENQGQLSQNLSRAKALGAPRKGPSLLGGLVYCGRCGKRLMVQYGGRADRLRYQCARASQNLGEPLCLGIVGRDLDRFVEEQILKILEPASLELCLAVTEDLEEERQRLDQQWRQKLERAAHQVDRAARQFHAVEPENRLVARTLEKNWEAALRDQRLLSQEYDEFRQTQPLTLDEDQRWLIRELAHDLPALWASPTTTPQERQQIVRMLIERIEINIEGRSERTKISITWAGGVTSRYPFRRTVISYAQYSQLDQLISRIVELKEAGLILSQVADQLSQEGFQPIRGDRFTGMMISRLLVKRGLHLPRGAMVSGADNLGPNEWWLGALAAHLELPGTTLSNWLPRGWVRSRKLPGGRGRRILWADDAEVERLRNLRSERRRWSDCPYPTELTIPTPEQTRHANRTGG